MIKDAGGKAVGTDPRLTKLSAAFAATPGVTYVSPPQVNKAGTASTLSVVPNWSPSSPQTAALVKRLRDEVIPRAVRGEQMKVYVGGQTAAYADLATLISRKLPLIIGIVIGLAFLLLMLAFRSLAIPASAAVMNLLSVAAAYGVLVVVFQWGWGASLLGYKGVHSIPIASYVPLMMFAVLFGLSMDYEVFLMSQIAEHHSNGMNDHDSVVAGLAYSARVITAAALIMVSVFASFILNANPTVKQFGVGLSVAVALDSTVVRILLVPAVMTLLGDANWWLPRWLARILPRVNIEGTGFFEQNDSKTVGRKVPAA
jgi:RND superfamily putative drug exporter